MLTDMQYAALALVLAPVLVACVKAGWRLGAYFFS